MTTRAKVGLGRFLNGGVVSTNTEVDIVWKDPPPVEVVDTTVVLVDAESGVSRLAMEAMTIFSLLTFSLF